MTAARDPASAPPFSVCEFTTLAVPLEQELELYVEAGIDGIGICEGKLPEGRDAELVAAVERSGLQAGICLPAALSVLPLTKFAGPSDPQERVEALVAGIRRLAPFLPACCYCLTGPQGELEAGEARQIVVDGLRRIAQAADEVGVRLGLEAIHASIRDDWTIVSSIPEVLELLEEVGADNLGIGFDAWHLWDTPNLLADIRAHAGRIVGVHVNDWRQPTRGWNDRVLPGDGVIDLGAIFAALEDGGYGGWYDLEIFSDDGTFEDDYEDSLWKLPPAEVLRRGRDGFLSAWARRR